METAPEQLQAWMERRGLDQRQTAEYFGWTESFISHIMAERRTPGLVNAVKIEAHTGIPPRCWVPSAVDKAPKQARQAGKKRQSLRADKR